MNETGQLYRLVKQGEVLEANDSTGTTKLFDKLVSSIGQILSYGDRSIVFRPVAADQWIAYSERQPTGEDFGVTPQGWIDVVLENGALRIYDKNDLQYKDQQILYWRRITPPVPPKPKSVTVRLKERRDDIGGRELLLNADGTVAIQCGEKYTAESIDDFIIAREKLRDSK